MRRLALPILTALAMGMLTACGGAATPTPAATAQPPAASVPAASGPAPSTAGGSPASAAACAAAPAGAAATVNVSIKDFKMNPLSVSAKVGDVVAWKNDDTAPHSATMDDGSCDTDTLSPGASGLLVFTAAGTYTYHCKVHASMTGFTVDVK